MVVVNVSRGYIKGQGVRYVKGVDGVLTAAEQKLLRKAKLNARAVGLGPWEHLDDLGGCCAQHSVTEGENLRSVEFHAGLLDTVGGIGKGDVA